MALKLQRPSLNAFPVLVAHAAWVFQDQITAIEMSCLSILLRVNNQVCFNSAHYFRIKIYKNIVHTDPSAYVQIFSQSILVFRSFNVTIVPSMQTGFFKYRKASLFKKRNVIAFQQSLSDPRRNHCIELVMATTGYATGASGRPCQLYLSNRRDQQWYIISCQSRSRWQSFGWVWCWPGHEDLAATQSWLRPHPNVS